MIREFHTPPPPIQTLVTVRASQDSVQGNTVNYED